ncbi:FtsW/RodA/SpoVE family cell cycle protein [Deinococcus lacus]|uniref:FtsW/RodA/SpoVE family cell cycle protein n=1 Tax=Deinococcus lacus TaxID=392561 RepID=A0ABW1Y8X3_9DEIO
MNLSLNLVVAQVLLLIMGVIGVATAEPQLMPEHALRALIALAVTFAVAQLRPRAFLSLGLATWLSTLVMLVLVLFIGEGTETSQGTKRWLNLGFVEFQPSELAKLGLVLQLASFFRGAGFTRSLPARP